MSYEFKSDPFPHQLKEFQEHRDDIARFLGWVPRTGKTKATIDKTCYLYEQGKVDGLFVLAPSGVQRSWVEDELGRHVPDRIMRHTRAAYYESPKAATIKHQQKIDRVLKHDGFSVLTMSYDGFMTERGKTTAKEFLSKHRCHFVADESWRAKAPPGRNQGALSKTLVAASSYGAYRTCLNGTPVANGPFDLYSQFKFLDPQFWANHHLDSWVEFKTHFGVWIKIEPKNGGRAFPLLKGYKRLDYLNQIIQPLFSRVTEDDADINLPEKLYSKRYFDMTPQQANVYQALRDQYMVEMADGELVTAVLPIVRLLRLQQVASGYLPSELEEPDHIIPGPNPRLDTTMEVVEDRRHKGIVWCRFDRDVDQVMLEMKQRGIPAVQYDGRVSDDDRARAKDRFQNDPEDVCWFVSKAQVGGSGLPLYAARTAIYHSNTFRLIDRLQSEDRPQLIGKKHPLEIIDVVGNGTVDERIVEALRSKFDVAAAINGDEIKGWI